MIEDDLEEAAKTKLKDATGTPLADVTRIPSLSPNGAPHFR